MNTTKMKSGFYNIVFKDRTYFCENNVYNEFFKNINYLRARLNDSINFCESKEQAPVYQLSTLFIFKGLYEEFIKLFNTYIMYNGSGKYSCSENPTDKDVEIINIMTKLSAITFNEHNALISMSSTYADINSGIYNDQKITRIYDNIKRFITNIDLMERRINRGMF